ncbi:MAG: 3'-5' exonuclease domain-containing protein 2 [Tannerellaceae bacterium]|jgi:ribonuclease D|nr:3'-5' exonuclease domain-containing protein 2 [Tannerellaceae bacterium]
MTHALSITKEEIALMPTEEYKGRIIVIDQKKDANLAIEYLSEHIKVGFDTETRPSFKKGQLFKIALMQIATEDVCFLFRLNKIGIPPSLEAFLSDDSILKIGLSLRDDFGAVRKRTNAELSNFLDLQDYVGRFGITDASLQKIYAILFRKKISKGQRLTNWEADMLSESQKKYAALDAGACLVIYNQLNNELQSCSET